MFLYKCLIYTWGNISTYDAQTQAYKAEVVLEVCPGKFMLCIWDRIPKKRSVNLLTTILQPNT